MLAFLDVSLPIWLVGVVVGELYLLLGRHRTVCVRIAFIVSVLAGCVAGWYYFEPPTPEQAAQPGRLALVVLTIIAVPLAVYLTGLELITRRASALATHLLLAIWAAAIAMAWPVAVIYSICLAGFECF